tara:strand:- start:11 stop:844 length:834 start_codon:yes stop_codon:yes gene_type:complete
MISCSGNPELILGDAIVSDDKLSLDEVKLPTLGAVPVDVSHLDCVMDNIQASTLMEFFTSGFCTLSLMVYTPDGTIVYTNEIALRGFPGFDKQTIKGKHLTDLAPLVWANERIRYMEQAAQTRKLVPMADLFNGTRLYTTFRAFDVEHNGKTETLIFVTVEPVTPDQLQRIEEQLADIELVWAEHIQLGKLSVLTSREIEVLALMGQGFRQKEIAKELFRSISTIDRHREKIGEKLGIKDRADLIALAREAGLRIEDAKRINMSIKRNIHKDESVDA